MYLDKEIEEFIGKRYFRVNKETEMCFTEDEVVKLMSDFVSELDAQEENNNVSALDLKRLELIRKIKPHPTEAITIFYDMDRLDYSQVYKIHQYMQDTFPDNKVVALPNNTSLESCSKDVLENIISMIGEVIEQL